MATSDESGSAWFAVQIGDEPVQIVAYADRPNQGDVGSPDATETVNGTVYSRTDTATHVLFDRPVYVCTCPAGSYVDVDVTARTADYYLGFWDVVHYGSGPISTSPPPYTARAQRQGFSNRYVLTVRAENDPVQIVAYADRGPNAGQAGVQDAEEVTGTALLLRVDAGPPTSS